MNPNYQSDFDSTQEFYDEYSSMVRTCYDELFEALLKAELESENLLPPSQRKLKN